jgi:hypothetical protein
MKAGINKKILAALIILFALCNKEIKAQSTPQQIMTQIYKKYDSLSYITFDVKYIYGTDTLYGNFKNEVLPGSYTMAGKKAKYTVGDIEFMQNDSFLISVYNNDKYIIVTNPQMENSGNGLPMRSAMDSIIQAYAQHYIISNFADTVLGVIKFEKADSFAQFKKFIIQYDVKTNFLKSIQYGFEESELMNPNDTMGSVPNYAMRQKSLLIEFSNYRVDNFLPELYNINKYIWFEDGEWKPISKYRDYKVYYSKSDYIYNEPPVQPN